MTTLQFTQASIGLAVFCALLFIIQLYYIYGIYGRVHRKRKKSQEQAAGVLPPLSVIIVTKDSAQSLEQNLPVILEQDYPDFEVIVVCDKSAGQDEDVLKRLTGRYPHLYHTFIPQTARYVSRKKLGVAMGIRASRNEWLVLTEPYCRPESRNWLRSLACQMTPDTDIVLGYSNYIPTQRAFCRHISTVNFFHSLRYLSMAMAGYPYMGVGRNLAYRKQLYESHKGFADHLQLQRGEDDLFINAVANKRNTRVAVSEDSIVRMPVPKYKRIWTEEKMNRIVTSSLYQGAAPFINAAETWTCFLFHLTAACAIAFCAIEQLWPTAVFVLLLWLIRFICAMNLLHATARDFKENLCCTFPLFDLLRPLESLKNRIQYLLHSKKDFMRK